MVREPAQNNWNLNLAKTFGITEKLYMEFRAELYHLFNHTHFKALDSTFSTFAGSAFGCLTGAHDSRLMQFGLRLTF